MTKALRIKFAIAVIVTVLVLSIKWWLPLLGVSPELPNGETLRQWFESWQAFGPAAIIVTMALAILVSPIPSAPIALAAGALYGHYWGTVYIIIGAQTGAIAAFLLSRYLGHEVLQKWFGEQLNRGLAGSQNFLTLSVLVSRLIPFISFDIVSYAAGLTKITFWRFAIATLVGIIPVSFLLAHLGSEMVADELDRIMLAIVVLGLFTSAPFIYRLVKKPSKD